ncbi:MAG: hypothetical protein JW700_00385 [Candidatus Aenigmarchaeota archaeon]|nr:hypothetical protein [Candidatus Aenigmarchaeota archaeon]
MERIHLIFLLVFLSILVLPTLYFYNTFSIEDNARNKVLNILEEKNKFCEIQKMDFDTSSKIGKFWLICNGRPFYADYNNELVSYDLNGWSWLKETKYWDELKECDVYRIENGTISFFCPKNISKETTIKYFDANKPFSLEKQKESIFFKVLLEDVQNTQHNIRGCILEDYETVIGGKKPVSDLKLNLECDDGLYQVSTDLSFITPFSSLGDGSDNIIKSFEKSFDVTPQLSGLTASYDFGNWKIDVSYPQEKGISGLRYYITLEDENALLDVIKRFALFVSEGELEFIKEEEINIEDESLYISFKISYYRLDGRILRVYTQNEKIIRIDSIVEGFYE